MASITSVTMSIKWNEKETNYFNSAKGLRQRDQISPYIFVLCMDKLSHMIMDLIDNGRWIEIKACGRCSIISHLMFIDDLLLFGKATNKKMTCVREVLDKFLNMYGQRINMDKTRVLLLSNTLIHARRELIQMPGYKETKELGKYLGAPLTGRSPKKRLQTHHKEY